jgi:hypothetical protein
MNEWIQLISLNNDNNGSGFGSSCSSRAIVVYIFISRCTFCEMTTVTLTGSLLLPLVHLHGPNDCVTPWHQLDIGASLVSRPPLLCILFLMLLCCWHSCLVPLPILCQQVRLLYSGNAYTQ